MSEVSDAAPDTAYTIDISGPIDLTNALWRSTGERFVADPRRDQLVAAA